MTMMMTMIMMIVMIIRRYKCIMYVHMMYVLSYRVT